MEVQWTKLARALGARPANTEIEQGRWPHEARQARAVWLLLKGA